MQLHGFKRGKSTTTASLAIQSALARSLDVGEFAILANLDLSSAFDVVNINLLFNAYDIIINMNFFKHVKGVSVLLGPLGWREVRHQAQFLLQNRHSP